jgi:ankyrin repeat protein
MNALNRLLFSIAVAALAVPASAQSGGYDGEMFVKAIREGNGSEALKLLQEKPTLVNARDLNGKTALITAIENHDSDWAGYLLQQGADPNQSMGNGDTPLMTAARVGLQDVSEWLISVGARVDETNRRGETALILAVQGRQVPIVRVLLTAGANPDRSDSVAGYSARDYAKRNNRTPELLRLIEAKKPAP